MKRPLRIPMYSGAACTIAVAALNSFKTERVLYLPFDIPLAQMAATLPPFGIFMESRLIHEGEGPCSVLAHERVHWEQYQRMGLCSFYYE